VTAALSTHSHRGVAWVLQEKDVKRTFPHYHFFNGEVERKKHYNAIKRILFIYAKLNPGIGYVQGACVCHPSHTSWASPLSLSSSHTALIPTLAGMNEILGPLYYIMTTDCDPEWKGKYFSSSSFFFFFEPHVQSTD
jgi:hypothetical protein